MIRLGSTKRLTQNSRVTDKTRVFTLGIIKGITAIAYPTKDVYAGPRGIETFHGFFKDA